MTTLLRPVIILRLTLLAAFFSLAAAYTAQYGFNLAPCHLCLLQRVPFALVIVLSGLGLGRPRWRTGLIIIIAIAFLVNSGIALYHTAVEQHWISGPSGCTQEGGAPANQSMDDFLRRIQGAPIVACDLPLWDFHGITMAEMNVAWSLLLSLFTFAALWQCHRKGQADA
jgi:disulfide bond formation protein DsbB